MGKEKKALVYRVNVTRDVTYYASINVAIPVGTPKHEVERLIEGAVQKLDREDDLANSYDYDDFEQNDVEVRDFDKLGGTWTINEMDEATDDETGDEELMRIVAEG